MKAYLLLFLLADVPMPPPVRPRNGDIAPSLRVVLVVSGLHDKQVAIPLHPCDTL